MVYSTKRFVLCLTLCYFFLCLFSPFSTAITSLVEERANLSTFRTFVRFALVWFCLFPLPLGVWEGLRIGYSLDIIRQTACLVVNPIIVDCYVRHSLIARWRFGSQTQ